MEFLSTPVAEQHSGPATGLLTGTDQILEIRRIALRSSLINGISLADAEDVAQDVLLQALRSGTVLREPRAWARTVAVRRVWDLKRNHDRETPVLSEVLASLAGPSIGHEKTTEDIAEREQILGWIRRLPEDHQEVIALYIDGYTLSEIADRLRLPPSVVRRRLAHAREKLREAFVAQLDEDRVAERAEQRSTGNRNASRQAPRVPAAEVPSPDEAADSRALADLPPRQQEVLRLSRRGYKPAQIAKILGLSPNTVRVNLFHARKRMRRTLVGAQDDRLAA